MPATDGQGENLIPHSTFGEISIGIDSIPAMLALAYVLLLCLRAWTSRAAPA
jgi:hypothetical protein